jgi:hypothetical protein
LCCTRAFPFAWWAGALTIGQLLAVQLLAGAGNVLFGTAYQVNLPTLVAADDLVEANAKLQGISPTGSLGGRGLGGLVVRTVLLLTPLLRHQQGTANSASGDASAGTAPGITVPASSKGDSAVAGVTQAGALRQNSTPSQHSEP